MHKDILKRCGLVLITIGIIDICFMAWCIARGVSYSSSFNIFAVIAGIFLFRGGLKTARWVATLSTFMLSVFVVALLVIPLLFPFGYWIAALSSTPGTIASFAIALVILVLLYWIRRQTTHPEVLKAQSEAGVPLPKTKNAVLVGAALPVFLAILLGFMLRGSTADEAVRRAERQLGGTYHYVVTNLSMSITSEGKNVTAIVAAYNKTDFRRIEIKWKE